MARIALMVNSAAHELETDPACSLLSAIRDDFGLTGTKLSCLEGICGACTVLVDGEPAQSCVMAVGDAAGRSITTIEGLADGGRLHPVQQAFVEELGFQCGFCTPGQIVAATGLLRRNAHPTDDEIRDAMNGNVCRCCAYPGILRAVRRAADIADAPVIERWPVDDAPAAGSDALLPHLRRPWDLQRPRDREYFTALGDGLVVVLPPEEIARHSPGHGPWARNGGAWLHVGGDDVVRAFTGKVDVGQDNRTALSAIVAEELRMPIAAVRLVMGDTDFCPFDLGTFGSRSIPDAGTYLRVVAAAAREGLVRLAGERLGAEPAGLIARDCRIGAADGRSVGYGELVAGRQDVQVATFDNTLHGAAGRPSASTPRADGALDAVLGRHRFTLDVVRPAMLVGLVVRAPSFGATLRSADVAAAAAMPGVTAVVEGDFVGVAAPDRRTARAALDAIRLDWDVQPQPSETGIADYLRAHPAEVADWAGPVDDAWGDVEAALESSARRLEATYTAAYIAHFPLETRDAVAEWNDGRLTVWTGTQRPFGVREELAEALGVAEEDVRVIVPDTGGGFGGKHSGEAAVEAARLARAAGRPVRIRWSRAEEMTWAYFRPYAVIDVRAGVSSYGSIEAWSFTNINSGAFAITPPYDIPNGRVRYQPADSPLRVGSYRALSATANTFARESAIDELAAAAAMDPLEFRLRHLADDRLAAVVRAAAERAGWVEPRGAVSGAASSSGRRGLGIACSVEKDGRVATVAEVEVAANRTLRVRRLVTAFECGRVIDPDGLRNQIEGATGMGLGGALFEAVHFEDGRILTSTLKEYRVPRMREIPPIEVVLVDRPDLPSAGAGETPIVAVAPAIANAIFAASGTRLRSMPLIPDGVVPHQ